ncbi:hypothetical protein [Lignipirellula cremea]|uniref:Uncharacterized protein n=1 Tax=Lignipirellula cremea TaxID=2528010 RepID=A0A518DSL1_9BACT|nr:hypothetical protein [Lignipirellula cremea]QDU94827.1 hypothetical protein Pla8534_26350 [Lignipirellula cremea]
MEPLWNAAVRLGDLLLGWTLLLCPEAGLIAAALLSAIAAAGIRWAATPQNWLHRAADDRRSLRRQVREAKRQGDSDRLLRLRKSLGQIAWRRAAVEGAPTLLLLPVLGTLAIWASARTAFEPIQAEQETTVTLHSPLAYELQLAHLQPDDAFTADGWIRQLRYAPDSLPPACSAQWQVRWRHPTDALHFRYPGGQLDHPLPQTAGLYPAPRLVHADGWESQLDLAPMRFFHIVPAAWSRFAWAPPWLIVYILISLTATAALRRLARIS